MLSLTEVAAGKVKEIMSQQNPAPSALRVAVVGGGCSGFSYHMAFDNQENPSDNVYEYEGVKVYVDQMSEMYLDGVQIDYIETLEGAGFKFNNPNVKSTCELRQLFHRLTGAAPKRPPFRPQTFVVSSPAGSAEGFLAFVAIGLPISSRF